MTLTFGPHAHGQTFLQATVLTPVAVQLCHRAVSGTPASIAQLFSDGTLKETFTALAAYGSIMAT